MKNSRYFRHDWGARNDPKILRLLRVKGAEAKAIYWDLVEMLYEQGGALPIEVIEDVAFANHVPIETARYVVMESGLFSNDETHFWSERQLRDENKIKEISEARQAAGRIGGVASGEQRRSKSEANAYQNGTKDEAINKINKNKDILDSSSKDSESLSSENSDDTPIKAKTLSPKECQSIIEYWNKSIDRTGANLPKVKALTEDRISKIRIRWREFSEVSAGRGASSVYRELVAKACASKFLQGDSPKGWRATFDWLFTNGKNWSKTLEGAYDDRPLLPAETQAGAGAPSREEEFIAMAQKIKNRLYGTGNTNEDTGSTTVPDEQ